jgi:hypothetical protein
MDLNGTDHVHVALAQMYWQSRRQERDAIHMAAWAAHHGMREKAVNVYANVRRIAGLMSAFEEDDFRLRVRLEQTLRLSACQGSQGSATVALAVA